MTSVGDAKCMFRKFTRTVRYRSMPTQSRAVSVLLHMRCPLSLMEQAIRVEQEFCLVIFANKDGMCKDTKRMEQSRDM